MSGESLGIQICLRDARNSFVLVTDPLLSCLGCSREELRERFGNCLWELIHPDDRASTQALLQKQMAEIGCFSVDYRLQSADGVSLWVNDRGYAVSQDGTDHLHHELWAVGALYELDSYHRNLLDALPTPLIVTDLERRVLFTNRALREGDDFPAECRVGRRCNELGSYSCGTSHCCIEAFARGERGVVQTLPNGKSYRVEISRFCDKQGQEVGYIKVFSDVTGQVEIERELRLSRQRYQLALAQTSAVIWEYDVRTRISYQAGRDGALQLISENLPEGLFETGLVFPDSAEQVRRMYADIHAGEKESGCVAHMRGPAGEEAWVELMATTIFDEEGRPVRAIGVAQDVTAEREREEQRIQSCRIRESLVADALFSYETNLTQNTVQFFSGEERCGLQDSISSYSGLFAKMQERDVFVEDQKRTAKLFSRKSLLTAFAHGKTDVICEYRRKTPDGGTVWVRKCAYLSLNEGRDEICAFIYVKDIDQHKQQEVALQEKAERDALTGVYNRIAVSERVNHFLAERKDGLSAMFMLDIDNFKTINDTYGHVFGDAVLSEISSRLQAVFRPADLIGRLGGDEFVIFAPKLGAKEDAARLAERICAVTHSSFATDAHDCEISSSVGIAFAPEDGDCFDVLYARADAALYRAKSAGKNQWMQYVAGMEQNSTHTPLSREREYGGGSFAENMGEYIFDILCKAENLARSGKAILELIGRRYDAARVFLVCYRPEQDCYSIIHEWCAEGVPPASGWLKKIPGSELGHYKCAFDASETYALTDAQREGTPTAKVAARMGARALVHSAIFANGTFVGFLGVDWVHPRIHEAKDLVDLRAAAASMGKFLYRDSEEPPTL